MRTSQYVAPALVAAFSAVSASDFLKATAIGLSSSSAAMALPKTGINILPPARALIFKNERRSTETPEYKAPPRRKRGGGGLWHDCLHRVRQRREVEVAHAHRRDQLLVLRFVAGQNLGPSQFIDIVQHRHRAFVEAEVLDRVLDLAVLDVEGTVARQAGQQHRLRIDHADIPGTRDQHALLGIGDQL